MGMIFNPASCRLTFVKQEIGGHQIKITGATGDHILPIDKIASDAAAATQFKAALAAVIGHRMLDCLDGQKKHSVRLSEQNRQYIVEAHSFALAL